MSKRLFYHSVIRYTSEASNKLESQCKGTLPSSHSTMSSKTDLHTCAVRFINRMHHKCGHRSGVETYRASLDLDPTPHICTVRFKHLQSSLNIQTLYLSHEFTVSNKPLAPRLSIGDTMPCILIHMNQ